MVRLRIEDSRYQNFPTVLSDADDQGAFGLRRPEWSAAGDDRKVWKIVRCRRRFRFPLERARLPGITSSARSRTATAEDISNKDDPAEQNDKGTDCCCKIGMVPTESRDVGIASSRHPQHAQPVNWEKCRVEAD